MEDEGPSPRVRGSPRLGCACGVPDGSIPACAGKPGEHVKYLSGGQVHPRVCGEALDAGTPPRSSRVHPRVCGEATHQPCFQHHLSGPSPRVRGSPDQPPYRTIASGSIPACAGKPGAACSARRSAWVHPRVCGEAASALSLSGSVTGPSPRVRGSRRAADACLRRHGSIPACAGKPSSPTCRQAVRWVHPRVCGEAVGIAHVKQASLGPSPRVRGSPGEGKAGEGKAGSIPACAGKPWSCGISAGPRRVHPRVCGEAARGVLIFGKGTGPSPRVRGSREVFPVFAFVRRSIPACAGKPPTPFRPPCLTRVHPRVCGEAISIVIPFR